MENIYQLDFWHLLTEYQQMLISEYIQASKAYYSGEEPLMSDPEFDALSDLLIDQEIPELTKFIESRIYRVNEGMVEVTEEFNQTQEMISLKKVKYKDLSSITEIKTFFREAIKEKKILYWAPKYDGAALKIERNENQISLIQSRGGLDVTELFKDHFDIKRTNQYGTRFVCGELLITKKTFKEKYFDDGSDDDSDEKKFKNPRNFIGKLLKQKFISKEILNDLSFIQCTDGLNPIEDKIIWTKIESYNFFYELPNIIKQLKSPEFPYLCDGIVIAYFEEGERQIKDNYPLNMLAVKFPATRAKTKVIGFDWSQKKSGKLTPRVILEPVNLDGSTISFTAGFNHQYLIDNHIGIGSIVEIEKSGDIIPIIVKVVTFSNDITLPSCSYQKQGKHLIAIDQEESKQFKFISALKILQIDGIGETLAFKIGEIINYQIMDLFNPKHKPDICKVLGGGSSWQKFQEFYNIKSLYLDQLIALLQFDGVGSVLSKKVALLITKKSNDTSNMSSHILTNVVRGEGFKRITESVQYLKIHGINVLSPIENSDNMITFEMTGTPPNGLTKQEFVKQLKQRFGNIIHTSLTKETNYLFCDSLSSNSGKINKSRKYNIKIMTYEQALKSEKL